MTEAEFYSFVQRITPLVPLMPPEIRDQLVPLIRDTLVKLGSSGSGLPANATEEMVKCVDDGLMRDIVSDLRHGPGTPGWIAPGSKDSPRKPVAPLPTPPKKPDYSTEAQFERMVTALVGGSNDTSKLR